MEDKNTIYIDFLRKLLDCYFLRKRNTYLDKKQYKDNQVLVDNLNYLLSECDNCKEEIEKVIHVFHENHDLPHIEKVVNDIAIEIK